ncbi:GNAT family N-acetyltransferase [Desulfosporosinus sp. PR]|uniref:GNAT family N-acetyltransferase n=1 Tax=Candidatus Desulfosporosinus nitrosoreducens TaxID=3401928 RepID=UPI0027ED7E19|nr:GNAT family N-acetyltransferase [Desulfosporosinus sp. PR]MDQ7096703.1 GNAT family N-acetyltransferase [Desulfosporosinus sp. PR]
MEIRQAKPAESAVLTSLSFASKRYWNYPEAYFAVWEKELTIAPEYIHNNIVYVAEIKGNISGYLSIVEVKEDFWAGSVFVRKGLWLEHIFILPELIGKGIGSHLMAFALDICRKRAIDRLLIFSDPNAKGFYDKLGARFIEDSPSSIEGRTVLLYELEL